MAKRKTSASGSAGNKQSDACLLVAFQTDPTLAFTESCPIGRFSMGGRVYQDKGYGNWTGFYDWLRTGSDHIVGVRYWPFERTEFLIDAVAPLQYVVIPTSMRCIEVYFNRGSRGVDPSRSDDQDFGASKVFFCEEEGRWLITFDTTRLSESEMQSLRDTDARWESVSASGKSRAKEVARAVTGSAS